MVRFLYYYLSSCFCLRSLLVYYRVYTEDGAIVPKTSGPSSICRDSSVARIKSTLVAPPHTIASLKRCLLRQEGFSDHTYAKLFHSLSSKSPLKNNQYFPILSNTRPGHQPNDPLAVVVSSQTTNRFCVLPAKLRLNSDSRYSEHAHILFHSALKSFIVYYRVYAEDGGLVPKSSLPANICLDSSVACIASTFVAPPHTIASLKRCLCRQEGFNDYTDAKLFLSLSSQSPLNDDRHSSILSNTGPGYQANVPLALLVSGGRDHVAHSDAKQSARLHLDSRRSAHSLIFTYLCLKDHL